MCMITRMKHGQRLHKVFSNILKCSIIVRGGIQPLDIVPRYLLSWRLWQPNLTECPRNRGKIRTGKIIDQVADNYANIKVIHNPSLNPGWLGKCNAMNYGLLKATGQYIIFTDADVIHKPGCFISAITEFEKNRYDFLSLFPSPVIKPFWENVIIPMYISGISQLMSTTGIEDPDTDDAVGTGAFMLVKKEALENNGGLDSIKGGMADDLALAKKIKRCGYKIGYRFAPDCMKVRLFKTNRDVFRNTVKNVLLIVDKRHWLAIPVIILSAVIFWLPLYAILSGVF